MPGESYCRWFRSLLLCSQDVFWVLVNSRCLLRKGRIYEGNIYCHTWSVSRQLAFKEQVNKLYQLAYLEIGRSVQSDSILLLKPPKLLFPLLFSPGLIVVMLSLLALLRFSLIQFKEWSVAQLGPSSKLLNLPTSLLYYVNSTGYQSAAGINLKKKIYI